MNTITEVELWFNNLQTKLVIEAKNVVWTKRDNRACSVGNRLTALLRAVIKGSGIIATCCLGTAHAVLKYEGGA